VNQLPDTCTTDLSEEAPESAGRVRALAPGMLLVRQFDPPGPMYLILSGEVRVLRMSANAPPDELARLGAGEHVGEIAALLEIPRSASVEAVGDVQVLELTPDAVQELAAQDSAFAQALALSLNERAGRLPAFLRPLLI
jgi:CRP/FNR family transcriptional regulator, cyclic AMP receptor protein